MSENPDSRNPQRLAGPEMDRVSVRLPAAQLDAIDDRVEAGEFPNRSEAIRAGIREITEDATTSPHTERVATDGGQR